jgi:hypothetical protein
MDEGHESRSVRPGLNFALPRKLIPREPDLVKASVEAPFGFRNKADVSTTWSVRLNRAVVKRAVFCAVR